MRFINIKTNYFKDKEVVYGIFHQKSINNIVGDINFVQDNESESFRGVLRGLHFQKPPHTQSKLVRCIKGSI